MPKKPSCVFSRGALHHQPGSASPQGRILTPIPCCKYGFSSAVKFFCSQVRQFIQKYWILGDSNSAFADMVECSPWVQWSASCKAELDKGFMCQKPKSHLSHDSGTAEKRASEVPALFCSVWEWSDSLTRKVSIKMWYSEKNTWAKINNSKRKSLYFIYFWASTYQRCHKRTDTAPFTPQKVI